MAAEAEEEEAEASAGGGTGSARPMHSQTFCSLLPLSKAGRAQLLQHEFEQWHSVIGTWQVLHVGTGWVELDGMMPLPFEWVGARKMLVLTAPSEPKLVAAGEGQ